jgi:hypothetical membrane protein
MTRDRGVGRAVGAPLGAVAWVVGTVQFFVAHLIAQSAWSPAYSWTANNISDLGNVGCGRRGDPERYICSPLHGWMSGSFVVHGLLIIVGAWLLHRAGFHLVASRMAAVLPTVAGLGWIGVGLAPADVAAGAHFVAAAAGLVCGTLGLAVAAINVRTAGRAEATEPSSGTRRLMSFLTVFWFVQGVVGLAATALFGGGQYLGLGMGGMERVAAFEVTLATGMAGLAAVVVPRALFVGVLRPARVTTDG